MTVLSTQGLSVAFGAKKAVNDFSLEVGEGQLVGLIGPNGAGKTTTIDAITGFVPATGTVTFDGTDISSFSSTQRARAGLGRTWQSSELFDDLTVMENLQVAAERIDVKGFLRDLVRPRNDDLSEMEAILDSLELTGAAGVLPTDLSHGQRKLVGVARALAARPKVLCMDEPAAGLDTEESQALGRRIRSLVDGGLSVLLIDHDMGLVLTICDYLYVLDFGQLIAEGTPAQIRADKRVITAYLGDRHGESEAEANGTPDASTANFREGEE
jgi:branched-chain amino acid transport system ATP-binding protein